MADTTEFFNTTEMQMIGLAIDALFAANSDEPHASKTFEMFRKALHQVIATRYSDDIATRCLNTFNWDHVTAENFVEQVQPVLLADMYMSETGGDLTVELWSEIRDWLLGRDIDSEMLTDRVVEEVDSELFIQEEV